MITKLKENQIFIFGSNMNGEHLGGSAKQAFESFGAEWGINEGITGNCYAFPTLSKEMKQVSKEQLKSSIKLLNKICLENKDKEFLLTKVGCGIAGFEENYIKSFFLNNKIDNLILPKDWL